LLGCPSGQANSAKRFPSPKFFRGILRMDSDTAVFLPFFDLCNGADFFDDPVNMASLTIRVLQVAFHGKVLSETVQLDGLHIGRIIHMPKP